jgi:hypothetical protein
MKLIRDNTGPMLHPNELDQNLESEHKSQSRIQIFFKGMGFYH